MFAVSNAILPGAVKDAIVAIKGASPEDVIALFDVKTEEPWTAGMALLYPAAEEGSPYLFLFIARAEAGQWQVALEYSADYLDWLQNAPASILSPAHLAERSVPGMALSPAMQDASVQETTAQASVQLGLPWAVGETQYLTSGPHSNLPGKNVRPWSALDFAGGSGLVRAPADGVVYLMPGCPYVQINLGGGWQAGFYHLINIVVSNGQQITRGTVLGKQSTAVTCGGYASGPHVHMTLRLNGQHQDWSGQAIGGWRVQDGSSAYEGCLVRESAQRCAPSMIYNDGAIGDSGAPVISNTPEPSRTPRPTALPTARLPTRVPTRTPTQAPTSTVGPISPGATATAMAMPTAPATATAPVPDPAVVLPSADVCGWVTVVPAATQARIPDNSAAPSCYTISVGDDAFGRASSAGANRIVTDVAVSLAMTHTWISDLRMQLRSPDGKILTLMNRPGWPANAYGFGSNLSAVYPITFTATAPNDAERMGSLDTRRTICRDDGQCEFLPDVDHDSASNVSALEDFAGIPADGNWQICLSDNAKGDIGTVRAVGLGLGCKAEPVVADVCQPVEVTPNRAIPDYPSAGACVDIPIAAAGTVEDAALWLELSHPFLGDLRAQLISPDGVTLTLMNRAGLPAARFGDTSNLLVGYPIEFADSAPNDAEGMGQTLGGNGVVCKDDARCRYRPNADGDPASQIAHLRDFAGRDSVGVWRVCLSDGSPKDIGLIRSAKLDLTCAAGVPEAVSPTPVPAEPAPQMQATATPDLSDSNSMLKLEEVDEATPSLIWLPMLLRDGGMNPNAP